MPPNPLREYFMYQVDQRMNPSMWETLDFSCSHISTNKIISISLKIQLNIRPLRHGKPQQFQKKIESVPNSYLSLLFWT